MQILADRALIDESDGACRERLLRLRALRDLAELLCVVLHNSNVPKQSHACIPENCQEFSLFFLFYASFSNIKSTIMMWELSILLKYSWIERKDQAREAAVLGLGVTLEFNSWQYVHGGYIWTSDDSTIATTNNTILLRKVFHIS